MTAAAAAAGLVDELLEEEDEDEWVSVAELVELMPVVCWVCIG
jgi:hypothetical protein